MSHVRTIDEQRQAHTTAVVADSARPYAERFPYGWRDAPELQPDGFERWTRIPLTLYDVIHPEEEDSLMPNDEHERLRVYLYNVISYLLRADPSAVLLSDTNVDWGVAGIKAHRPDIAVIFQVRERKIWSTFAVVEEGVRPLVVFEITSPKTRHTDFENKLLEYELVGLQYYFIIDLHQTRRGVLRNLYGYQLTPEGYIKLPPNELGWQWVEPLKMWLVVREHGVVCHDAAGDFIADYVDMAQARDEAITQAAADAAARVEAEVRAKAEAAARAVAEARAQDEAAARAAAITQAAADAAARAAAEARAAAATAARVEAEARAAAEAQRRAELEARLVALEEELKRRSS